MPQPRKWIDEILEIYEEFGGIVHYDDVYRRVQERNNMDLAANPNWKAAVRRTVEQHSSDSEAFLGRNDLFYSVEGKGKGIWGLRQFINFSPVINYEDNQEPSPSPRVQFNTYRYLRDTQIAKEIKREYKNICQVCEISLNISKNSYYSEAHHIKPLGQGHNGPDVKENLIVLCPNHHAEFDYGAIAIEPDTLDVLRSICTK